MIKCCYVGTDENVFYSSTNVGTFFVSFLQIVSQEECGLSTPINLTATFINI